MTKPNELPKRVLFQRTAMCGGGLSYDVLVPVTSVNNYEPCRYTTVCGDGYKTIRFEDAIAGEEHFAMPKGWDRYEDMKALHSYAESLAYQLAVKIFPELEKVGKIPMLWVNGLMKPEVSQDVLFDTQHNKVVAVYRYEDGKRVRV